MSVGNLLVFLRTLAARADLLDSLRTMSKPEVIAVAADLGLPFTEAEFDATIWDLELRLARRRGENFDARFGLWETMWGKYYLEYLVLEMLPGLQETGPAAAPPQAAGPHGPG